MKLFFLLLLCVASLWAKHFPALMKKSQNKDPRIIGGHVARPGQFSFMAAIDIDTDNSQYFCGGALISNEWILTAAQCVNNAVLLTIRLGSNSLSDDDPNRLILSTSHVVIHPEFRLNTLENDVGLIKLRLPIEFNAYVQPIQLTLEDVSTDNVPTAVGWGQTTDADPELSSELVYVNLAVLSNEECSLTYGGQITDNMVCVDGNYNEGTCKGDSGGPLVYRPFGSQELQHVAISSFYSGNGCESPDPSGYTRTFPYGDWIRNVTGIL